MRIGVVHKIYSMRQGFCTLVVSMCFEHLSRFTYLFRAFQSHCKELPEAVVVVLRILLFSACVYPVLFLTFCTVGSIQCSVCMVYGPTAVAVI